MNPSHAFARLTARARECRPKVALVLGSGMGAVARRLEPLHALPFEQCPGLTPPSVAGHNGSVTLGDWAGQRVLVFEGRLHFYEGHPWDLVTAPVRTAAVLGARMLLTTNAAGGISPALGPGCLMAVRDHIEWTRNGSWQQRTSSSAPYSERLGSLLARAAQEMKLQLHRGTYAAVTGPCYETAAEIRALRAAGADAVGMSTACEVQAGFEAGMECAAVSCITNRAAGLSDGPIHHQEVLSNAAAAADKMARLLEAFLRLL
jgi:purine-nucleoside phosphorylase